jgi:hypothetical protein
MKYTLTKTIPAVLLGVALVAVRTQAQPVTLSGTNYTQNFDGIGSGLPGEWVLYTGASATALGTISTTFYGDLTVYTNKTAWSDTGGAFKNFASVTNYGTGTNFLGNEAFITQSNAVNRALGIRSTSAFGDGGAAFVLKVANTTGFGKFKLDVDMLLLSPQGRTNTWNLDFGVSPDGSSPPTSFTVVSNKFYTALGTNSTPLGVFGATHKTIDFGTLLDNQPGPIFIRIWNNVSGGANSRPSVGIDNFSLSFTNIPIVVTPPVITTPPASQTAYVGYTATLTVVASGTAPFTYQWYKNDFSTPVGNGTATLTISPVTSGDAGDYYVVVGNSAGSATNSTPATVTVTPRVPIPTTIYNLRTNQDNVNWSPIDTTNHYTVTGVVISRTNMTTSANASFYIEDTNNLCGIDVFIAGDTTTRPAYGDIITVTGPVGQFNGVLEMNLSAANPTHIVTNLGASGYNVPAKALAYESTTNTPLMETNYEGSLVVVSGVTIQGAGVTNFVSGASVNLTNASGKLITLFIDSRLTDIIGQPIPTGLVNITGYVSQFKSTAPYTGSYQLVPTYAGAIVAAPVTPTPEPIVPQVQGGNLIMSWTQGNFYLASSTNVLGPYVKIPGATSPYTNNTGGGTLFFRLVYP